MIPDSNSFSLAGWCEEKGMGEKIRTALQLGSSPPNMKQRSKGCIAVWKDLLFCHRAALTSLLLFLFVSQTSASMYTGRAESAQRECSSLSLLQNEYHSSAHE